MFVTKKTLSLKSEAEASLSFRLRADSSEGSPHLRRGRILVRVVDLHELDVCLMKRVADRQKDTEEETVEVYV